MRTSIASPTALESLLLDRVDRFLVDLGDVGSARPSMRSPASSRFALEIDDPLRQRDHRIVEAGADATDRRFEVGDLDTVVLVDPLFHRQHAIDASSCRWRRRVATGSVRARRVAVPRRHRLDRPVRARRRVRSSTLRVDVRSPSSIRRDSAATCVVDVLHDARRPARRTDGWTCAVRRSASGDRCGLVLEVVAQRLAHRLRTAQAARLAPSPADRASLALIVVQRLVLMVRELGEPLFERRLQGALVALVGLMVRVELGRSAPRAAVRTRHASPARAASAACRVGLDLLRHRRDVLRELTLDRAGDGRRAGSPVDDWSSGSLHGRRMLARCCRHPSPDVVGSSLATENCIGRTCPNLERSLPTTVAPCASI